MFILKTFNKSSYAKVEFSLFISCLLYVVFYMPFNGPKLYGIKSYRIVYEILKEIKWLGIIEIETDCIDDIH